MMRPGQGLTTIVIGLGLVASAVTPAGAQPRSGGVTSQAGFDQELGAKLPLAAHFRDESGRDLPLGEYFGRRPAILAPVYYGCPLLCGQLLAGLVRGLKPLSLEAGRDFDVIAFSIDPSEGPALALSKKNAYLERYDRPGSEPGWHFLTGEPASITALAAKIGFRYTYNQETKQFTHAAGVVVVTPEGVVSRYFFGIDYPPKELQRELEGARAGVVGSPIGKLLLLCYDYDAATGKYTVSILQLLRVLGTATAISLAGFLFVMIRREGKARRGNDGVRESPRMSRDDGAPSPTDWPGSGSDPHTSVHSERMWGPAGTSSSGN
jgi:protein SCO1/2